MTMFKKDNQPKRVPKEMEVSDRKLVIKDDEGVKKTAPSDKNKPDEKK